MRIAVVSDVHGSLTALETVVADLNRHAPDLTLYGGDVAVLGPSPAQVVDRVRELGWPGVVGNTDEMLWRPELRAEMEARAPKLQSWLGTLFGTLSPWAAEALGEERVAWLQALPGEWRSEGLRLLHASPGDLWRAPMPDATDAELEATYGGGPGLIVYGHVHRPYVRRLGAGTVANAGSAALPWDGDPRPSYLLIEGGIARVHRVEPDLLASERELRCRGFPLAAWLASVQRTGTFRTP